MEVAILVPLIVFASIVLIIGTPFYFHHRNRRVIYDAIKTSVEKTGEADPKLIAAITHDAIGPNADLRRGILLASFGAAPDLATRSEFSACAVAAAPLLLDAATLTCESLHDLIAVLRALLEQPGPVRAVAEASLQAQIAQLPRAREQRLRTTRRTPFDSARRERVEGAQDRCHTRRRPRAMCL